MNKEYNNDLKYQIHQFLVILLHEMNFYQQKKVGLIKMNIIQNDKKSFCKTSLFREN